MEEDVAKDITKIMGLATHNLDHPIWKSLMTPDGLCHVVIWVDNTPAWSGIAYEKDYTIRKVKEKYPNCEITSEELVSGFHY